MSKATEKILTSLDKAFKKLNYQSLPQISKTKNQVYGDYSSSSPLSLAKETGQSPIEIAKKIQQELKFDKDFPNKIVCLLSEFKVIAASATFSSVK